MSPVDKAYLGDQRCSVFGRCCAAIAFMYQRDKCSQAMYDTLLPLFSGVPSHVEPVEAHVRPIHVSNESRVQPISDAGVRDALDDERTKIEEARAMPKWLVQTLRTVN